MHSNMRIVALEKCEKSHAVKTKACVARKSLVKLRVRHSTDILDKIQLVWLDNHFLSLIPSFNKRNVLTRYFLQGQFKFKDPQGKDRVGQA
jgi:hypothetical protein